MIVEEPRLRLAARSGAAEDQRLLKKGTEKRRAEPGGGEEDGKNEGGERNHLIERGGNLQHAIEGGSGALGAQGTGEGGAGGGIGTDHVSSSTEMSGTARKSATGAARKDKRALLRAAWMEIVPGLDENECSTFMTIKG